MHYTVHGILQARILEWVALPFSRGYSQPRDQTQVSHTAEGFFTSWDTREPQGICLSKQKTQETRVQSLGWKDPLEEEIETHSSFLDWEIPWTEELGRLQSMGLQRVKHNWTSEHSKPIHNGKEKNALLHNKYWPPMSPSDWSHGASVIHRFLLNRTQWTYTLEGSP